MTIHIERQSEWKHVGDTWVRGQAFLSGELLDTCELGEKLDQMGHDELTEYLSQLNGFYAAIKSTSDRTILISDHVRSWPLYYSVSDDQLISDSSNYILSQFSDPEFDPIIATEYLFTSYATGDNTLSEKIHQTQAGEIVSISDDGVSQTRHYTYSPDFTGQKPTLDAFRAMCQNIIERFIEIADGRTIVLGLSEGVDSRLLAIMLAKTEYDDVVAYTRGSAIPTGRKIANDLGFDFVPIWISESDYRDFYTSDEWDSFHTSIGFIDSLPQIKRYLVLDKLQQSDSVPDDAIFTLGHQPLGGSLWTGQEMISRLVWSYNEFIDNLNHPHFDHYRFSKQNSQSDEMSELFGERVLRNLPSDLFSGTIEAANRAVSGTITYYWQERTPKFIMSDYEYDYFGFDRWYPFWDKAFLQFWSQASSENWAEKWLWTAYTEEIQPDYWEEFFQPRDSWLKSIYYSSPQTLQRIIKPAYDFVADPLDIIRPDGHVTDSPIFGLVTEQEFQKEALNFLHPHTFHYLILYNDDYFTLEKNTELDLGVSQ